MRQGIEAENTNSVNIGNPSVFVPHSQGHGHLELRGTTEYDIELEGAWSRASIQESDLRKSTPDGFVSINL